MSKGKKDIGEIITLALNSTEVKKHIDLWRRYF